MVKIRLDYIRLDTFLPHSFLQHFGSSRKSQSVSNCRTTICFNPKKTEEFFRTLIFGQKIGTRNWSDKNVFCIFKRLGTFTSFTLVKENSTLTNLNNIFPQGTLVLTVFCLRHTEEPFLNRDSNQCLFYLFCLHFAISFLVTKISTFWLNPLLGPFK